MGMGQGPKNQQLTLAARHGEVVSIHTLGIETEVCRTKALPLMRDLPGANAQRAVAPATC